MNSTTKNIAGELDSTPRSAAAPLASANRTGCLPGILLLIATAIVGLLHYRDYGVSYDEPAQWKIGMMNYNYVMRGDPALLTFIDRYYGAGFEMPLIGMEVLAAKFLGADTREVYQLRHLVTHLFFLCSVFCGYLLARRLFGNQWMACLAFVLLAFHPRLYAHSYFNTKDIPLLSMCMVLLLLTQIAFEKNRLRWYLLLGLAAGYTISLRIVGIALIGLICLLFAADFVTAFLKDRRVGKPTLNFAVFAAGGAAALIAASPLLWTDPIQHLLAAYDKFAHYPWQGDDHVLFMGTPIRAGALPAIYIPVWIAISTPLVWLAAGVGGVVWIVVAAVRDPLRYLQNGRERNFLLYAAGFVLPILAIIILHSTVYDDWRHLYFTYPCLVFAGLFAVDKLRRTRLMPVVAAAFVLQIGAVAWFSIANHPFQQVYFNRLVSHAPESLRQNFELDYWGCSYKQALEYIVAHDSSPHITIRFAHEIENNLALLSEADRARIQLVTNDNDPAIYLLTDFRYHPADFAYQQIVYQIKVQNSTIMRVYKLQ